MASFPDLRASQKSVTTTSRRSYSFAGTGERSPVAEHVQADVAGDARNPAEGCARLDRQLLEALVHQKDQRKLVRSATIQERGEALSAGKGGAYGLA